MLCSKFSRSQLLKSQASSRFFSAATLQEKFESVLPQKREQVLRIKKTLGGAKLGDVTVGAALGGMRGLDAMVYDTSNLDPVEGIRFKGGHSIPEICKLSPKATGGQEPLPEAVYWLLLTGEFPSEAEMTQLQAMFRERAALPQRTIDLIQGFSPDTHPMTQLSMAIMSLQSDSKFAAAYNAGETKGEYWRTYLEDSIDMVAKLPEIAARIYQHLYKNDAYIAPDNTLDWAGNYAHMMGYQGEEVRECIRGYLSIHSDHEGGNVSAHTCHLVSSALSDPYLSYSAAVNGLAGPLHGLANQEVLRWLIEVREQLGDSPSNDQLLAMVQQTIKSGKVVPGYGHAVLRNTDPRYTHQKQFAQRYIKDDVLVNLTAQCYEVIPPYLESLGKVKNPYPNVDAHSGVLLHHFGLTEFQYYTVVFAVSRALGCTAANVWSRALGLPIERPGSITLDWIEENVKA